MIETIAYLGPAGTFTQEASQILFPGPQAELVPYPTIPDVFTSIEQGVSDLGVVPVENAIEGSVNSTVDWLIHHAEIPIVGELTYPITQCLMVHPSQIGCPSTKYKRVLSHPQAIAQCQLYLREKYPQAEWVYTDSTAQAAQMLRQHPEEPWLAIGTQQAAKSVNLHVLQAAIQDHDNNFTRFIAVGHKTAHLKQGSERYKTSLKIILPEDYPGALYQVLATFSWRKINLSYIESRPTKTGLGNYLFMIDAEIPADHVLMKGVLAEIEALDCSVRVLGSYPCFHKEMSKTIES